MLKVSKENLFSEISYKIFLDK